MSTIFHHSKRSFPVAFQMLAITEMFRYSCAKTKDGKTPSGTQSRHRANRRQNRPAALARGKIDTQFWKFKRDESSHTWQMRRIP